MKKIAIIVGAVALASISTSIAQTTAPAPTPVRQLDDTSTTPSLVTDLTVKTNDSPLVRAAKAAAANRRRATGIVINDSYVKSTKGRIIETPKLATLPKFDDEATDVEAKAKAKAPIVVDTNRAVEQKTKLKEEQARRAEEMDDPYGDPDAAAQRMHEIEQEQKQESSKPQKSQNVTKRP